MLPWFEPEITPQVLTPGVRRVGLDPADAAANVRAVVEAQMMAMRIHSAWMGERLEVIHATGGAAANRGILQVMADVFGAEVCPLDVPNSAVLGAALRACHAVTAVPGDRVPEVPLRTADVWERVLEGFVTPRSEATVRPRPEYVSVYAALTKAYAAREREARG